MPINYQLLKKEGMRVSYFRSDVEAATIQKINELDITEGDFIFVLGFPMGLVGEQKNTVIVCNGSIAKIRDTLSKGAHTYLVDAFVFPGNSGGPVILKPEALSIIGTKSQSSACFIGRLT